MAGEETAGRGRLAHAAPKGKAGRQAPAKLSGKRTLAGQGSERATQGVLRICVQRTDRVAADTVPYGSLATLFFVAISC